MKSVWLLLSWSLQQSLWGILASVPHTTAKKCTHKISSDGGPVKRVQMLRRIPARCSGWDEAWSWISKVDCRTKYVMDYVELPSEVQKVDNKDCDPEDAESTGGDPNFDVTDEKYLAIAFGSATVALLILVVIIVISLIRRGQSRCGTLCRTAPGYTAADRSEREHLDDPHNTCNEYIDDTKVVDESEYEEIMDPSITQKKLGMEEEPNTWGYQNMPEGQKPVHPATNGVNNGAVIPSAPYEEDLQQTARKCVPNEYTVVGGNSDCVVSAKGDNCDNCTVQRTGHQQSSNLAVDNVADVMCPEISSHDNSVVCGDDNKDECDVDKSAIDNASVLKGDSSGNIEDKDKVNGSCPKSVKFDDLVLVKNSETILDGSALPSRTPVKSNVLSETMEMSSPGSTHSYENLDPTTQETSMQSDYDALRLGGEIQTFSPNSPSDTVQSADS